jgi:hypothetical protein
MVTLMMKNSQRFGDGAEIARSIDHKKILDNVKKAMVFPIIT